MEGTYQCLCSVDLTGCLDSLGGGLHCPKVRNMEKLLYFTTVFSDNDLVLRNLGSCERPETGGDRGDTTVLCCSAPPIQTA